MSNEHCTDTYSLAAFCGLCESIIRAFELCTILVLSAVNGRAFSGSMLRVGGSAKYSDGEREHATCRLIEVSRIRYGVKYRSPSSKPYGYVGIGTMQRGKDDVKSSQLLGSFDLSLNARVLLLCPKLSQ